MKTKIATPTKIKIIKIGQSLLQIHGYHGFSFQDIADELKIKKPSLYDHYASKEELIEKIILYYSELFEKWVPTTAALSGEEKILKVFDIFYFFAKDHNKVCPILALTTDMPTLSRGIQNQMKKFINRWLDWLTEQITQAQNQNEFRSDLKASDMALMLYNQGMGVQIQSRIHKNPELILQAGKDMSLIFKKQRV